MSKKAITDPTEPLVWHNLALDGDRLFLATKPFARILEPGINYQISYHPPYDETKEAEVLQLTVGDPTKTAWREPLYQVEIGRSSAQNTIRCIMDMLRMSEAHHQGRPFALHELD